METQHDVFHRADERMRQTLNQLRSTRELVPQCPHPKSGRLFMDAHEDHWAMCAGCAFLNEADASLRYDCDVCGSEFRATPDDLVFAEVPVLPGAFPALGDFFGTLIVTLLTPCTYPECQAMARAYEAQVGA